MKHGRGHKKNDKKTSPTKNEPFFFCFLHPHHVFFSKPCPPIIQPQTQRSRASHTCSVLFSCVGVVVVSVDESFFRLLSCSFIHSFILFPPFFALRIVETCDLTTITAPLTSIIIFIIDFFLHIRFSCVVSLFLLSLSSRFSFILFSSPFLFGVSCTVGGTRSGCTHLINFFLIPPPAGFEPVTEFRSFISTRRF